MCEILKLEAIYRAYHLNDHNYVILDDAEYSFYKGQMTGLLAPSGAGKSTLLYIAGLLEHPDGGEVLIGHQKTSGLSNKVRTLIRRDKIGFIYQLHHLLPEFTALENVMMPLRIRGHTKASAKIVAQELLEQMFLGDRLLNRPFELSGGEQQRVAIARALANEPEILLADEPTGNLDPHTSQEVFQLLLALVKEKNMCALIATHDQAIAEKMDKCITLREGKLVDI